MIIKISIPTLYTACNWLLALLSDAESGAPYTFNRIVELILKPSTLNSISIK